MPIFSLDHLDDTTFEELCFDLLGALEFTNVDWRKGTGLDASPADGGRDIECERIVSDPIDGSTHTEKWFVQCKHYKRGVPPEKLQGALAWAMAERVDWLVIIASNFLSNPAKEYLEAYKRNNKPHFKIKVWERPELEKLTASKTALLKKYDIPSDVSFISIMHPAHLLYIQKAPLNTLDYFFEVLDAIDSSKRDSVLSWVYTPIIQPRRRAPVTGNEIIRELYIDEISYEVFKAKCYQLVGIMGQMLFVHALISFCLSHTFTIADKTKLDDHIHAMHETITFWQSILDKSEDELKQIESMFDESSRVISMDVLRDRESTNRHIDFHRKIAKDLPNQMNSNYALYWYFCENVIAKLLQEKLI